MVLLPEQMVLIQCLVQLPLLAVAQVERLMAMGLTAVQVEAVVLEILVLGLAVPATLQVPPLHRVIMVATD